MDQLAGIGSDVRLARQAHEIRTRADLDRWKKRSTRCLRFIAMSYVIGSLSFAGLGLVIGLIETIRAGNSPSIASIFVGIMFSLIGGFVCGGPLVLLPCTVLVTGGVSKYKRLLNTLNSDSRVCHACGAVALFEDKFVVPRKDQRYKATDLVPHMNILHEEDKTHILCDACLSVVGGDQQ